MSELTSQIKSRILNNKTNYPLEGKISREEFATNWHYKPDLTDPSAIYSVNEDTWILNDNHSVSAINELLSNIFIDSMTGTDVVKSIPPLNKLNSNAYSQIKNKGNVSIPLLILIQNVCKAFSGGKMAYFKTYDEEVKVPIFITETVNVSYPDGTVEKQAVDYSYFPYTNSAQCYEKHEGNVYLGSTYTFLTAVDDTGFYPVGYRNQLDNAVSWFNRRVPTTLTLTESVVNGYHMGTAQLCSLKPESRFGWTTSNYSLVTFGDAENKPVTLVRANGTSTPPVYRPPYRAHAGSIDTLAKVEVNTNFDREIGYYTMNIPRYNTVSISNCFEISRSFWDNEFASGIAYNNISHPDAVYFYCDHSKNLSNGYKIWFHPSTRGRNISPWTNVCLNQCIDNIYIPFRDIAIRYNGQNYDPNSYDLDFMFFENADQITNSISWDSLANDLLPYVLYSHDILISSTNTKISLKDQNIIKELMYRVTPSADFVRVMLKNYYNLVDILDWMILSLFSTPDSIYNYSAVHMVNANGERMYDKTRYILESVLNNDIVYDDLTANEKELYTDLYQALFPTIQGGVSQNTMNQLIMEKIKYENKILLIESVDAWALNAPTDSSESYSSYTSNFFNEIVSRNSRDLNSLLNTFNNAVEKGFLTNLFNARIEMIENVKNRALSLSSLPNTSSSYNIVTELDLLTLESSGVNLDANISTTLLQQPSLADTLLLFNANSPLYHLGNAILSSTFDAAEFIAGTLADKTYMVLKGACSTWRQFQINVATKIYCYIHGDGQSVRENKTYTADVLSTPLWQGHFTIDSEKDVVGFNNIGNFLTLNFPYTRWVYQLVDPLNHIYNFRVYLRTDGLPVDSDMNAVDFINKRLSRSISDLNLMWMIIDSDFSGDIFQNYSTDDLMANDFALYRSLINNHSRAILSVHNEYPSTYQSIMNGISAQIDKIESAINSSVALVNSALVLAGCFISGPVGAIVGLVGLAGIAGDLIDMKYDNVSVDLYAMANSIISSQDIARLIGNYLSEYAQLSSLGQSKFNSVPEAVNYVTNNSLASDAFSVDGFSNGTADIIPQSFDYTWPSARLYLTTTAEAKQAADKTLKLVAMVTVALILAKPLYSFGKYVSKTFIPALMTRLNRIKTKQTLQDINDSLTKISDSSYFDNETLMAIDSETKQISDRLISIQDSLGTSIRKLDVFNSKPVILN